MISHGIKLPSYEELKLHEEPVEIGKINTIKSIVIVDSITLILVDVAI